MPPKSVPKLTKKQLDEQKKEQARLQKQKQQEEAAAEKARLEQQQRVRQLQRKKKSEEQRVRIVEQKEKFMPTLQQRIRYQNESYEKLIKQQKWQRFTTPYLKDYNVDGTSLSTFTKLFTNYKHAIPKQTIVQCEQCEKYIAKLQQKSLFYRAQYDVNAEKECQRSVQVLQRQVISKLQQIMIQFANGAEEMQDRNVEEAKKKNEQSTAQKASKPIDSIHVASDNFKLGMCINTISTKNYNKFNPLAIKQFGFNTEVPPKWMNNTTIVKFEWLNFNQFSPNNKEQFRIVGGVFNLEFYDMFVGTKRTNNICIKKYYKGKEVLQKFKLPSSAIKQPFKIMYEIPKYVFMVPYSKHNLKIGQYDVSSGKWSVLSNQSISDYIENQKKIVFRILKPQPIALVENNCADYPYIAWQLRTVEKGKVLLDFQLARAVPIKNKSNLNQNESEQLMIQFQIGPNVMKLQTNVEYPEFKDLYQNYMTPQAMLYELSKRGVHLLPTDQDYQFAGVKIKNRESQKYAIRDIAYAVQAFTIRSEINDSEDIKVKIRENLDLQSIFLEDQQKDWKRIRWGDNDKCWVDGRGINQRHCNLQILLEQHDFCNKECLPRINSNNDYLLRKTVMRVLELTRLLAFTVSKQIVPSKLVQTLKSKIIVQ